MGRVLVSDVSCHLGSSNAHVRKKAALALIRILKRVPEFVEDHTSSIVMLLKDRFHGVLIAAIQLVADVSSSIISCRTSACRVAGKAQRGGRKERIG